MIDSFLAEYRPRVDAELDQLLPSAATEPSRLHEAMRYAIFGGGKRLRPICCLLATQSLRADPAQGMAAACALELVHTYSLVHDDLPCMDDDDLRRGRPTVHRQFDEALAVLVGDGLQTLAFEVLSRGLPPASVASGVAVLARASGSIGMVGGQVADLDGEGASLDRDAILAIDRMKTAALFRASFVLGGLCGGASEDFLEELGEIGEEIGISFQIIDDLLDRRATPEQLGKATGKDAERGKATLVDLLGEEGAFAEATERTDRALALASRLPDSGLIEALVRRMLDRTH